MPKKILALAAEPISADVIKDAVGPNVAEGAEVLVVAPALNTKARFWLSDPDAAIARAQEVAAESEERMEEDGVDAVGQTGESDPLLAIQDALATFPADEIVLVTHPDGQKNWLEEGVVSEAQERFADRTVRHLVVD
jgi:hypothetical protein